MIKMKEQIDEAERLFSANSEKLANIKDKDFEKETHKSQNEYIIELLEFFVDKVNKVDEKVVTKELVGCILETQMAINKIGAEQNNLRAYLLKQFEIQREQHRTINSTIKKFYKSLMAGVFVAAVVFYLMGTQHETIKPYLGKFIELGIKTKE